LAANEVNGFSLAVSVGADLRIQKVEDGKGGFAAVGSGTFDKSCHFGGTFVDGISTRGTLVVSGTLASGLSKNTRVLTLGTQSRGTGADARITFGTKHAFVLRIHSARLSISYRVGFSTDSTNANRAVFSASKSAIAIFSNLGTSLTRSLNWIQGI